MTVRESLPFAGMEALVGLLASVCSASTFVNGRPLVVVAVFFAVSVVAFTVCVHMLNEAKR